MAPLTESNSGNTINTNKTNPKTWKVSIKSTNKKCDLSGILQDLKKQILAARIITPTSGTANDIIIAHIQAIRSSSGISDINCLSLPKSLLQY